MIVGLVTRLGVGRLARAALRCGLMVGAVLLLLLSARRSGERLGRLLERVRLRRVVMTFSGRC